MPSILDSFRYPHYQPEAQQLLVTLSQLNPTVQNALLIAQRVDIDTTMIDSQQPVFFVWKQILEAASTAGILRELVQEVYNRLNLKSPMRPFLENLLANNPTSIEIEPRDLDGAPNFISDTDDVSEPEALLYYEDLTIQIGRVPSLIQTLQNLVTLAPAVCRLIVDVYGNWQYGTGFRIGPDLLLTNWHVLHRISDGTCATAVTAEFGYEDDGSGGALAPVTVPCEITSIVTSRADDWAVIRAKQPLSDSWPIINLSQAVAPALNSATYIIQHPRGERKRLGFVRNQVSSFDDRVVHYLTDTQVGSSGAPVLNQFGQLIALHHAGGRPQEVVGKPPLKKNEGIRISRIVEGLEAQNASNN